MPKIKLCSHVGCYRRVPFTDIYCAQHAKEHHDNRKHRSKKYRIKNPLYSSKEWIAISKQHKENNPLCVQCGNIAHIVDHILPVKNGGTNDSYNLQSLCRKCHNRKTVQDFYKSKKQFIVMPDGTKMDVRNGKNIDKRWDI